MESEAPEWPAYLLRLYLVIVYFGSGWRKVIYGNWLDDPHALFQCMTGFYTTDLTRWLHPVLPALTWTFAQYFAVAFELGAPLLLLYPSLRKWGVRRHYAIASLGQGGAPKNHRKGKKKVHIQCPGTGNIA